MSGDGSPLASEEPAARLGVGLDIVVEEGANARFIEFVIVAFLHGLASGLAHVRLYDSGTDELLASFDSLLDASRVTHLRGRIPLDVDRELVCEAQLADDPRVRAEAFAWIVRHDSPLRVRAVDRARSKGRSR